MELYSMYSFVSVCHHQHNICWGGRASQFPWNCAGFKTASPVYQKPSINQGHQSSYCVFTHVLLVYAVYAFCCWVVFYFIHFFCWLAFVFIFFLLAAVNKAAMDILEKVFLWTYIFLLSLEKHRSEIPGSKHR